MNAILALSLNTFREAVRNKLLYSALAFALCIIAGSALFGSVSIGDQARVIKDFGLFSLSFFGMVIAVTAGVNLLNKELKQKTIYNILSKPVDRWQFILGKQLGLILTTSCLVSVTALLLVGFVALFEGRIDWLLFQAIGFILLELAIVASFTIFFSSVVVTTTLTGLFTIAAYITGRSISYLQYFLTGHAEVGSPAVRFLVQALQFILPDLSLFNISNPIVYGDATSLNHLLHATAYASSYCLILFLLSALIFNRRELQ